MIPPLLGGNQLVTDRLVKEDLFNIYFSQQCKTIDINSSILANVFFFKLRKDCLLLKFVQIIL